MEVILWAHIAGASLALAAGFVAIAAPKGATWHRQSGMLFVYGMSTMAVLAVFMSAVRGGELLGNIPPGLLSLYLVVRGTKAVRPPAPPRLVSHVRCMCGAFFIATGSFFLGQADEIPRALRVMPALTLLAFTPLIVMVYWVRRLKRRPASALRASARQAERAYGATTRRFSTV
jgi:uncharacterized membrane protein